MRSFADAQATSSMTVAFVERHRGQVPLNFDEGGFNVRRFATRAWACGERVRYPTVFSKSLIRYLMTGDGTDATSESNGNLLTLPSREEENDKVVNRGKPGAGRSTRRTALKASLLDFRRKTTRASAA